jgi:hypothetical protein
MNNPMDAMNMYSANPAVPSMEELIQRARQNPKGFEDYIRNTNPQAYQRAMEIRNSPNPQAIIRQMMQSRNVNPNILRMLGIM